MSNHKSILKPFATLNWRDLGMGVYVWVNRISFDIQFLNKARVEIMSKIMMVRVYKGVCKGVCESAKDTGSSCKLDPHARFVVSKWHLSTRRHGLTLSQKLRVGSAEMPKAGEGEVITRNRAVAINPIPCKLLNSHHALSMSGAARNRTDGIQRKFKAQVCLCRSGPVVLDMDVAGEIFEVGAGLFGYGKGKRVMA